MYDEGRALSIANLDLDADAIVQVDTVGSARVDGDTSARIDVDEVDAVAAPRTDDRTSVRVGCLASS